jgi:archaellum component FlaC
VSKTKNRERSEVEYLRGQIRELESENRQLRRRLKTLDKKTHLYEGIVEAVAEEIKPNTEAETKCKKCKIGTIRFIDVKHAKFFVCSECHHREKA